MKKEMLGLIIFISIFVLIFVYAMDRFEKINNGEITVVNQNQMDR